MSYSLSVTLTRSILICDVANIFMRAYSAFPSMNVDGEQMGGVVGTLKILQKLVREIQPSVIYMAWEGGGSSKRRAIYKDYKMQRKPEKLNRFYEDDIPDTEENRKNQMLILLDVLKATPVCQLYAQDAEGDDLVAYLCNRFKDSNKTIVSSDRDLYQLLDERTQIYSLHKKTYVTAETVLSEFGIPPHNFALAKALCGDDGDNVPGIKGLGFKTAVKKIPILRSETPILIDDVINYCYGNAQDKMCKRVTESIADVKRNWRLVVLDGSALSVSQSARVDNWLKTFKPVMDRVGMMKKLHKAGITSFDVMSFASTLSCVDGVTQGGGSK